MTEHSTHISIVISDLAEGSTDKNEAKELISPFRTATIPVVNSTQEIGTQSAETGVAATVEVKAEGSDADDAQDASRTTEDTKPSAAPEKESEIALKCNQSVLIVEDSTELAEVIQATLERMKLVTAHETHGVKAIAKFKEMNPDVVLLDIGLPDMTGWEILDAIRGKQDEGDKQVAGRPAIIVITAYGDPANRLVGKLQDIHSYLIKPFTPDEVEKIVRNALRAAPK